MMNAHQARDASNTGRVHTQEKAAAKRRAEEEKRRREEELYCTQRWPIAKEEVEKAIKDATDAGLRATDHREGTGAMVRRIEQWLTELGYHVRSQYYSTDIDYGDTEAPCVVNETGYTMTISW